MKGPAAAKALGVSESTVRSWIQQGAPVISPGSSGRGRGAEVDPEALYRWRYVKTSHEKVLQLITHAIQDVFIRDGAAEARPVPLWQSLDLAKPETALLLLETYDRIHRAITGEYLEGLEQTPDELRGLLAVCVECKDFHKSSEFRHGT